MKGESIPVYGDGQQIRDWIYVTDHCAGLDAALHHGEEGEVYNFGAGNEWPNIEIARRILQLLGQPESLLTSVQDRPGHDRRYALASDKAYERLHWVPQVPLEEGLKRTVEWYRGNGAWLKEVAARGYRTYYRRQYERRGTMLSQILDAGGMK